MIVFLPLLLALPAGVVVKAAEDNSLSWRPDLPWADLASSITGELIDTTPSNYLQECASEYDKPVFGIDPFRSRSNHGLIDQPSGLCLPNFFCAFDGCAPADPNNLPTSPQENILVSWRDVPAQTLYSEMNTTIKSWIEDVSNPSYNLPSKVLFPHEAKDVVAAVKFAMTNGLEISVKNSGHSYTSASSKGNTLHLNMNKYFQYATNAGVIDCTNTDSVDIGRSNDDDILRDQPCRLSLAKGKEAAIRVGGGENWQKVGGAVRKANEEQEDGAFKYHIVSGAAATVSPMGWTFQVGLSAASAGRALGFGADQVLQIEMVLPNGAHVKFGPTEWEVVEGYDVPKTISVSGLCNTNPQDAEENWVWDECPEQLAVNFNDLWFAVRGGGGGTWGVVLSMHLQLHEYMPLETINLKPMSCVEEKLNDDTQKAAFNHGKLHDPSFVLFVALCFQIYCCTNTSLFS